MNHNLHNELADPIQRLAIAMEPATYIRPLRHQAAWLLQPSRRPATDPMLFTEWPLIGSQSEAEHPREHQKGKRATVDESLLVLKPASDGLQHLTHEC